jgi:hypothetical protein
MENQVGLPWKVTGERCNSKDGAKEKAWNRYWGLLEATSGALLLTLSIVRCSFQLNFKVGYMT